MAFEEAFGCEIPDNAAEKIATVQDAIRFIEAHSKAYSLTQKVVAGGERLLWVRRRDIRQHQQERARCAESGLVASAVSFRDANARSRRRKRAEGSLIAV